MTKLDDAYAALGAALIGFTCFRRAGQWAATIMLEPTADDFRVRQLIGYGPTPSDAQMDALVGER